MFKKSFATGSILFILSSCFVLTTHAGIGSILLKAARKTDIPAGKVDNFAPDSIHTINKPPSQVLSEIGPNSQSLSEAMPSSQILSGSPQALSPKNMKASQKMAQEGQGQVVQKADGTWYFIPSPTIVSSSDIDEKKQKEPLQWHDHIITFILSVLVVWVVCLWILKFFRFLRKRA